MNQYAYQTEKFCEQAIHELTWRVEKVIKTCISSMLRNRTVYASENLCSVKAFVAAGCQQCGVLSSLLSCLVIDDLLHDYRAAGFHTRRSTCDIILIVCGKFEGVVCERMQVAFKLKERLCQREGLNINSKRTPTFNLRCPTIFGSWIPISGEIK